LPRAANEPIPLRVFPLDTKAYRYLDAAAHSGGRFDNPYKQNNSNNRI
jgi:hypothetical protein